MNFYNLIVNLPQKKLNPKQNGRINQMATHILLFFGGIVIFACK